MEKIKLHDKTFRLSIPYGEIESAIDAVARKINDAYRGVEGTKAILCVLNGAIMFTSELMKRLDFDTELITMKLSSYAGTASTGEVRETMTISGDVRGKHLLIVEDIIDSGRTPDLHDAPQARVLCQGDSDRFRGEEHPGRFHCGFRSGL